MRRNMSVILSMCSVCVTTWLMEDTPYHCIRLCFIHCKLKSLQFRWCWWILVLIWSKSCSYFLNILWRGIKMCIIPRCLVDEPNAGWMFKDVWIVPFYHFSDVKIPSIVVLNTSNQQYFLPHKPIESTEDMVQFINEILEGTAEVRIFAIHSLNYLLN